MMVGKDNGAEAANQMEIAAGERNSRNAGRVFAESFDEMVRNAGNEKFLKTANSALHDGHNDIPVLASLELVGVDSTGKNLRFVDAKTKQEVCLTKSGEVRVNIVSTTDVNFVC